MKYIVFWEFCPEDIDKAVEKFIEFNTVERKKHPDKYPKIIFPTHSMAGETKGFEVVEATSEQIVNHILPWMGLVTFKFVPILEAEKIGEGYLKSK